MITTGTADFMRARRLGRLGATVLVILGFLVVDEKHANAGCVTTCSGTAAVTVDPPLDCATFNVEVRDCYCMAVLHVDNACTFSLQASGFTFGCDSCDKVEPGAKGAVSLLVHENGAHGSACSASSLWSSRGGERAVGAPHDDSDVWRFCRSGATRPAS